MILKNGNVFIDGRFIKVDLQIYEDKIVAIEDQIDFNDEETLDCTDKKIIPGLIDIHTHGCLSYDFTTSSPDEIESMCKFYASHGVTSILATTMTNEEDLYRNAMSNLKVAIQCQREQKDYIGASIEGIYMEGPFFGKEKRGAHCKDFLKSVSQSLLDEYQKLSGDAIKIIAIDPTLENAIEFIQQNHNNYTISLAHTDCTYDVAKMAVIAGATHVTHVFNGMSPMNHREPGLIGAASEFHLNTEIICDGIHIHPAVVHLMFRAMPEQMILISDAIKPTGMPNGEYMINGLQVTVENNMALLADKSLAGSLITLFDAVRNAINFGVPCEEAIMSATYNPAKSIHMENIIGSIGINKRADILVLDQNFQLEKVILRGKLICS